MATVPAELSSVKKQQKVHKNMSVGTKEKVWPLVKYFTCHRPASRSTFHKTFTKHRKDMSK